MFVILPIIRGAIHDNRFHRRATRFPPARQGNMIKTIGHSDGFRIRIQKNFAGIIPMTFGWFIWAMDTISIELAGLHTRDEDVPVMIRFVAVDVK